MIYFDWIDQFSVAFGLLLGFLCGELARWRKMRLIDGAQESLRQAEGKLEKARVDLLARERDLERGKKEVLELNIVLEEKERSLSSRTAELNEWWTKAQIWVADVADREKIIEAREVAARAEVDKARAALKGARARARRLLTKKPRQPGR